MDRPYNDFIGDQLKASKQDKPLKGAGKPFSKHQLSRDVFQSFQEKARDAGFLPEWIESQKEIAKLVETAESTADVDVINEKIRVYNQQCPPSMQRGLIDITRLPAAREKWGRSVT